MPAVTLPHEFHDGPGNPASGVQVMDNLNALKAAVEGGVSLVSHKKDVETEETRENTAYGVMPTPDEVTGLVVPNGGMLEVSFWATWKESVLNAALAAVFVGANQLRVPKTGKTAPEGNSTGLAEAGANQFTPLFSCQYGLTTVVAPGYTGDVATGQALGAEQPVAGKLTIIGLPAGTYTLSVRYKASSGKVIAKNRHLRVVVIE